MSVVCGERCGYFEGLGLKFHNCLHCKGPPYISLDGLSQIRLITFIIDVMVDKPEFWGIQIGY